MCGDAIATIEGISREALDALALVSQQRADRAIKEGRFAKSVVPVHNPDGSVALDREEFPRPETTAEGLAALKPSFAGLADFDMGGDRKSTRLTPVTNAHLVCRLLLAKKNINITPLQIHKIHQHNNTK